MQRAILLAALAGVAQAQVPHTLDLDEPASAFTWDGTTSLGRIVGVPNNNFNLSGETDLDLWEGASQAIDDGQFSGGDVILPYIVGEVQGAFGFVLATIELSDVRFACTSASFGVAAGGGFSTSAVLTATQGTLTITPIVGSPTVVDLTGLSSDPTPVSGTLTVAAGDVHLDVPISVAFAFSDPGTGITGSLSLDGTLVADALCTGPQNYCVLSPNSVGPGAEMTYGGSNSASANDLVLVATGCPSNQFGLFFYGTATKQISVGDGTLCVGGTLKRFPAVSIDTFGIGIQAVDLGAMPGGDVIPVGETRFFAFWYRDPTGGPVGYNFSDGLEVQFCL